MTPKRKEWWDNLPQEEQKIREAVMYYKKIIKYDKEYIEIGGCPKSTFKVHRLVLRALKKQVPTRPYIKRNGIYCTCCDGFVSPYMGYCPECGHKLKWKHNTTGGNKHGA